MDWLPTKLTFAIFIGNQVVIGDVNKMIANMGIICSMLTWKTNWLELLNMLGLPEPGGDLFEHIWSRNRWELADKSQQNSLKTDIYL